MGVTATFQRTMQFGLMLSCDSDLKSDWDFQLSGSGSNSLNWRKLPSRFSLPKRPENEARHAVDGPPQTTKLYRACIWVCIHHIKHTPPNLEARTDSAIAGKATPNGCHFLGSPPAEVLLGVDVH